MASHGGTCPRCGSVTSFTKTGLMRSHKRSYGEHCPYSGVTRAEAEEGITSLAKATAEYQARKDKGLPPKKPRASRRSRRRIVCPGCDKTVSVRINGQIGNHRARSFPGMSTPSCRFAGVTPDEAARGVTWLDRLVAKQNEQSARAGST